MRDFLRSFALYTTVIAQIILSSCNRDNNDSTAESEPVAEYTLISYGCGGGTLDATHKFKFDEVEAMGYQENVQFTAMYKYSASYQQLGEEYEGTRLYTMEPSGELSNTKIGDADLRLDEPQTLADFIIDAKRRLPAKKYILSLFNHGSVFDITDQPVATSYDMRSTLRDDNNDNASLSIFELDAALEIVGEKMDMLYWESCLMNTLENNYQIREYFDYILGTSHLSTFKCCAAFINELAKSDDIIQAAEGYADYTLELWRLFEGGTIYAHDMTIIDTSKLEAVVEQVKCGCDIICEYRDGLKEGSDADLFYKSVNGDTSSYAKEYYFSDDYNEEYLKKFYTGDGYQYIFYPLYEYSVTIDVLHAFRQFLICSNSGAMSVAMAKLNDAIDDMIIYQKCFNLPDMINEISAGVVWMPDVNYHYVHPADKNYAVNTMAELYSLLEFDKATQWGSKFLSGNAMQAVGYDADGVYSVIDRNQ